MDPLSVTASVGGIAATGLQLSQTIYDLVSNFNEAEKEMMTIANNLSHLAAVFNELEGVLRQDSRVYRRRMIRVVNEILENCEGIFQNISKYISVMPRDKISEQFQRKVLWYFQRHRVRPLQAGLESMKSTLNVLLHVVLLARISEAAESFIPNAGTMVTDADVQKEKDILVGVVLDNQRSILVLKQIEEDRDDGQSFWSFIEDKQEVEDTADDVTRDDSASTSEYISDPDASHGLSLPARSASHSAHTLEVYDVSEHTSTGTGRKLSKDNLELDPTTEPDDLPGHSTSHRRSRSQSPASEYYETLPEVPITNITGSIPSDIDTTTKPGTPAIAASVKMLATKSKKGPKSQPDTEIGLPPAEWFLSVVPHESNVAALEVRPRSGQESHLRARAEETAKTLLLDWTNIDPDSISDKDSGGWTFAEDSNSYNTRPARDNLIADQYYRTPYASQAYPTYVPQQWYPYQPVEYSLPPSTAMVTTPPLSPKGDQTDREELARLKKLILDEKAEQDMRAAAVAAATPPLLAPSPPIVAEESREHTIQRDNTYVEAVDTLQMPQDHSTLWKANHPRLQPVIMRDWLGRKFIFPVNMCQTWAELHNLIQGAFGHEFEYRSMVEKGKYLISIGTGEYILPSTWEYFVQPGLEISMEILAFDANRYDPGDRTIMGGSRDTASPEPLIPPHAPEVSPLQSLKSLRSRSDGEHSVDNVTDDETECSSSNVIGYTERSDPRYLSIGKVLLEQKQARVDAEMKLERNRRFFQLKQQLVDQGAAIQAREDAADRAEQDSKLAWLEKRVRDQKEELDRLSPLVITPPGSSAGESLGKPPSSPQRRASFGARLLGRMPSPMIRSKSQQMITER